MKIIEIEFATPEFDNLVRLRQEVLWKPLGLEFTAEQLAEEYQDFHLGMYQQNTLVGGLSIKRQDEQLQVRQVVVKETAQQQGIGKALIEAAMLLAKRAYCQFIELDARDTAVAFYEKLGFEPVGKPFIEMNIEHQKMRRKV